MKYASNNVGLKSILGILSFIGLSACGGSGQDDGRSLAINQNIAGTVVDGYVARGTVYFDSNENGLKDAWEPFAFTDNQGYYSYNPITLTDYCATDATEEQQNYCLTITTDHSEGVIRIEGGYDVLTGEPFLGQMSRRVAFADESGIVNTLISPITTLVTNITDDNDRAQVLGALGLTSADLDIDYLNVDGTGQVNAQLLNQALAIHKTVTLLADRLVDTYDEIGEETNTPYDASSFVYNHLSTAIQNSGGNADAVLTNSNSLRAIVASAEQDLVDIYAQREIILPTAASNGSSDTRFERVAAIAANISTVVDNLIDANATNLTQDQALGGARALETVVIKTIRETTTPDTTIDNAVDFFTDSANSSLVDSMVTILADETTDISTLSNNDFTGSDFDSADDINNASQLPNGAEPFSLVANKTIKISDLDLGISPNRLNDSEVLLIFSGELSDSTNGEFTGCAKVIEDANIDGTLGEGNTRGEIFEGFWSLLSPNQNNESYSLLLTVEFLGTVYQAIMKPRGSELIGNIDYDIVRFDNDGEITNWHSESGFTDTTDAAPTTALECRDLLPSRIGI